MLLESIVSKTPIDKGWSGDRKYKACDASGKCFLLRLSPAAQFARKQRQFEQMQRVAALGIPMCQPLEFGMCAEGAYSIQSWIHGADAQDVIAALPPARQYAYGQEAGRILAKIHTVPAPEGVPSWPERFNRKIDRKLQMYAECPLKYENGGAFIAHIAASRHLLEDRPQTYQHGDYHIGNMMIDDSGTLTIIDFDRDDYGDPWEEFNRIVWCAQDTPYFASGMVDGYFAGPAPLEFWNLLALYISSNTLSSLPWAIPYGQEQIDVMRAQAAEVLDWYAHMTRVIPSWYQKP